MKHRAQWVLALLVFVWGVSAISVAAEAPAQFASPILVVNTSFLNVRTGPSAEFSTLTTVVGGTELPVLGTVGDGVWYQVSTAAGVGWVNVEFTLARGDFRNVPLVEVTSPPAVPVIVQPGPAAVAPAPVVQASSAGSTTTTPQATTNQRFLRVVPRETLVNVYPSPDINSNLAFAISGTNPNIDYAIIGQTSAQGINWFQIDVPGKGTGWVDSAKISIRLGRTTSRGVVTTTRDLTLTSTPGAGNGLYLVRGTEGYIIGISADSLFVQLELADGTTGYASFDALQQRTGTTTDITPINVSTLTVAAPATTTGTSTGTTPPANGATVIAVVPQIEASTSVVIINTSFLNIRSGPSAQYTTVFTARGGSEFTVLGLAEDGVWFLISGTFGQGWVNNEFVIFRGSIERVPIIQASAGVLQTPVALIGTSVQLYAAPGVNFGALGTVVGPVEAPIVARTSDFEWIQINTSAGFGWVLAAQVAVRGDASLIPVVQ